MSVTLMPDEPCKVLETVVNPDAKKTAYIVAKVLRVTKDVVNLEVYGKDWKVLATALGVKKAQCWKLKENETKKKLRAKLRAIVQVAIEEQHENVPRKLFTYDKVSMRTLDGLECVAMVQLPESEAILTIVHGEMIKCTEGAIVNAANKGVQRGGGIDGAISEQGGLELAEARKALPVLDSDGTRCKTGEAVVTIAGGLPCEYVIHAVGPRFGRKGPFDEHLEELERAYASAMECAARLKLKKVAFPVISAGIFRGGCPLVDVIDAAIKAITKNVYKGLERVYFCPWTAQERELTDKLLQDMEAVDRVLEAYHSDETGIDAEIAQVEAQVEAQVN